MRERRARGAWALCLLLVSARLASAQDDAASLRGSSVSVVGEGLAPLSLTPSSLASFPQTEVDVAFRTGKGESRGRYRGVLLWTLLQRAGVGRGPGHHDELRRTFLVTGRDGYAVAFSVGEIAPDFGGTRAMVATTVDGAALPAGDGIRLIVPGDRFGARSVRDVVAIEVR